MDRRGFLKTSSKALLAAAAGLGPARAKAGPGADPKAEADPGPDLAVLDAHAHPYWIHRLGRPGDPLAPSAGSLVRDRVAACAFAAVGDMSVWNPSRTPPKADLDKQLDLALHFFQRDKIRLLTKAKDLESGSLGPGPAGFLAVEGGDCLEGRAGNVDHFQARGVRMMSLVHYRINELGDIMTAPPKHGGLTKTGARVVERINRAGMILDLSHAEGATLKQACRVSARPVIDSHCAPVPLELKKDLHSRLRTWEEMEAIVAIGGLICLWPFGFTVDAQGRKVPRSMALWAAEARALKERFGAEHVGLGTDSGGNLPRLADGWRGPADWPPLYRALEREGLSRSDLEAFFGGNLNRIWKSCLS